MFIAVSLVGAFWAFGFAEKISVKKSDSAKTPEPNLMTFDQITHDELPSEIDLSEESSIIATKDVATIQRSLQPQKSKKIRLAELESKEFRFELRGTALLSSSTISKDVTLTIKMRPIQGTNLKSFAVNEARLVLGSNAMQLNLISVEITDYDVVMTVASGSVGEYRLNAKIDEMILSDNNNKQNTSMQDQLFYLVNKDVPYKLTLRGTLTS